MIMMKNVTFKKLMTNLAVLLCIATLTLGLMFILYNSSFTRMIADDYCLSSYFITQGGIFQAIQHEYYTWSGRYAAILLVGISEWLGLQFVPFFSVTLIVLWVGGLFWLIREISKLLRFELPWHAILLLAELTAFFVILLAPHRFQSIYWRTGSATYFAPIVVFTYLAAFILGCLRRNERKDPPIWVKLLVFIVAFFGGGFSETTLAWQIGWIGLGLFIAWLLPKGDQRRMALILLSTALFGFLASFVVMFLSPGSRFRQSLFPEPPPLFRFVWLSLRYAAGFLRGTLKSTPIPNLFLIIVPASIVYLVANPDYTKPVKERNLVWTGLLATPLMVYLLLVCVCAPSVYAVSAYPEPRALLPGQVSVDSALVVEGALLGYLFRRWTATLKVKPANVWFVLATLVLALSGLYPLRMSRLILVDIPEYRQRALLWDQRHEVIQSAKAQGMTEIEVRPLDNFGGLLEIGPDTDSWVNRCAAAFYGIQSLTAGAP